MATSFQLQNAFPLTICEENCQSVRVSKRESSAAENFLNAPVRACTEIDTPYTQGRRKGGVGGVTSVQT